MMVRRKYSRRNYTSGTNGKKKSFAIILVFFVAIFFVGGQAGLFSAFTTAEGYKLTMDFSGITISSAGFDWSDGDDVEGVIHEEGRLIVNPDGLPPSSALGVQATGFPKFEFIMTDFIFLDAAGNPSMIPEPFDSTVVGDNKISFYKVYFGLQFQTITEFSTESGTFNDVPVNSVPSLAPAQISIEISGITDSTAGQGYMLIHGASLIGMNDDYYEVGGFGNVDDFQSTILPILSSNPSVALVVAPTMQDSAMATQGINTAPMGNTETGVDGGYMTVSMDMSPGAIIYDDGAVSKIDVVGEYDFAVVVGVYSSLYDSPVFSIGNKDITFSTDSPIYLIVGLILAVVAVIGIYMFVRTKTMAGTEFFREKPKVGWKPPPSGGGPP